MFPPWPSVAQVWLKCGHSGASSFELGVRHAALTNADCCIEIPGNRRNQEPRHMNVLKNTKEQRQSVMPCRKERIGRICQVILKKFF